MAKAAAKKDDSNVVELRKNGPAEDAVVALNLGKIQRASAEFATANGAYRNTLKHVESKGIDLAAAKDAIAIRKSGKVEEKLEYLRALFQYLKILGTPVTKAQLDLFAVEAPRTPSVDKAKEHGRYTGIMGQGTSENPYAIDSEQGQAWIAAFHEGTKERELILSMEPTDELLKGGGDDESAIDDEEE